ncbi:hypothetical protein PRJ39_23230 [Lysobacter enzymogenes]|uniref:hypothetical protein n=1 Tax=Lysobacter enzymogenes TaxID=69 RepID=UPI00374A3BAD
MNDDRSCRWGGIHVELGEIRRPVESIANAAERFKAHKLPMNPELLDYGVFRQSVVAPQESVARAIAGTLSMTGAAAQSVDLLIVATADPQFLSADRGFFPALLERTGLTNALPLAVTGQECASLLSALDMAIGHVRSGARRNVLVVSQDSARSDEDRIQTFGVVSDASAACLVSADLPLEFLTRGFSLRSDLAGMRGNDDFASRKTLIGGVSHDVVGARGLSLAGIERVFATNFFRPISSFNASSTGLSGNQLYTGSAREVGHCLNADPLMNLSRFLGEQRARAAPALYLLQAFAPGFLAAMLIEDRGEQDRSATGDLDVEAVVHEW